MYDVHCSDPTIRVPTSDNDHAEKLVPKLPAHHHGVVGSMNVMEMMGRVSQTPTSCRRRRSRHTSSKSTKHVHFTYPSSNPSKSCSEGPSINDDDEPVMCRYHIYDAQLPTNGENDCDDLWWNERDMQLMKRDCMEVVYDLKQDQDYIRALQVLWDVAEENGGRDSDNDDDKDDDDSTVSLIMEESLDQALYILAQSPQARGLERRVLSFAWGVKAEHQSRVLQRACHVPHKPHAIRRQSLSTSRLAKEWAASWADFDAQEAAVAYYC
eukprot:CAMPEP_0172440226 /NCGR_PEP_ID=MMETSP1065-20121228/929_1 /TAXON_ID=265537 /ORGANISM="Amphiprora paludosa, Strain CCMP125" /LENGTH=267 /DNA_ID=CAMNT_0013189011 /DNA_START=61 /DNA_END=864 /DNA_ORIENTATION=-